MLHREATVKKRLGVVSPLSVLKYELEYKKKSQLLQIRPRSNVKLNMRRT